MTEYREARPQEEGSLLDFINMVFSQAHRPHDFARLLPKVYAHAGFSRYHWVAVVGGRIVATTAVLPLTLRADGRDEQQDTDTLRVGFVGSVSSHPYFRGEGHMQALLRRALEDASDTYDLLALSGQRQRYGYFGFEKGGTRLIFEVNAANVRHAMADVKEEIRIREVLSKEDAALPTIAQCRSRQAMMCTCPQDLFWDVMHSWQGQLFALEDLRLNGAVVGYLYTQGDSILEMALDNERRVCEVIKAWVASRKSASVRVPVYNRVRASFFKSFAENYRFDDEHMFRVVNWQHTLEVLLRFKADIQPLCDGRFVFEVTGKGRYAVCVRDHAVSIAETQEAPDMCFTEQRAVEFFFSPFTAWMSTSPMLRSWLPVPLGISAPDAF